MSKTKKVKPEEVATQQKPTVISLREWESAAKNAQYTDPNAPLDNSASGVDNTATKRGHREFFRIKLLDGTVSEQWLSVPPDDRRCINKVRKGPYVGYRCRKLALRGARVCANHGGSIPNVKKAAQMRILAATDLVAQQLVNAALSKSEETKVRLRAMDSVLDRAGVTSKEQFTVEIKPWQAALQGIEKGLKAKRKGKRKGKAKRKKIEGKAE